jgi:hypothetical protein
MKKILSILICLAITMTAIVGCNKDDKSYKKNANNVAQVEESTENIDVNMDIRDTAIQVQGTQLEGGELEGEKVFAVGVVSSIDATGENMDKANFIITQSEGEDSKSYVVAWTMGKLDFQSLQIADGDVVKVYGVLEGKNKEGIPIIKTSLMDLAM